MSIAPNVSPVDSLGDVTDGVDLGLERHGDPISDQLLKVVGCGRDVVFGVIRA
jgi:hypothetical protein